LQTASLLAKNPSLPQKQEKTYDFYGLKISRGTLVLNCAVIAIFILAITYFTFFTKSSTGAYFSEGPLHKISALKILGGENYTYEIKGSGGQQQIAYSVSNGNGCTSVGYSLGDAGAFSQCFRSDGTLVMSQNGMATIAAMPFGSAIANSGLGLPNMFFAPWMLALAPGWSWQSNATYTNTVSGFVQTSQVIARETTQLRLVSEEKRLGRDSYKVIKATNSSVFGNVLVTYWIDREKLAVLDEESENYSMVLTQAPFALSGQ